MRTLLVFTLLFTVKAQALSLAQLTKIEALGERSPSALVRKGLNEELAFRKATAQEIGWYLNEILRLNIQQRRDATDVIERVKARIASDLITIKKLNARFKTLSPSTGAITWSAKANKLDEILTEASSFFSKHAELLLRGQLPQEFHRYWELPRCLGACETRASGHNSRELALKASLLLVVLELRNEAHVKDSAIRSLADSPLLHTTQMPVQERFDDIHNFSFFYNGTLSPVQGELSFVHGGYAFGGQSNDWHYRALGPYGKTLGPQDCASWVSRVIGLTSIMWTKDFANFYRRYRPSTDCGTIEQLRSSPVRTIEDVRPGMILVTRSLDDSSGHAQIIIDVDTSRNNFIVIERSRDLPKLEGFGVSEKSFEHQGVNVMYFEVRDDAGL